MTQPEHPAITHRRGQARAAYRPAAAARRMGISRSQLSVELTAGNITARKYGKCTLIPRRGDRPLAR